VTNSRAVVSSRPRPCWPGVPQQQRGYHRHYDAFAAIAGKSDIIDNARPENDMLFYLRAALSFGQVKVKGMQSRGSSALGHYRWARTGLPSSQNHPPGEGPHLEWRSVRPPPRFARFLSGGTPSGDGVIERRCDGVLRPSALFVPPSANPGPSP
jgi:hypothetical protein